MVTTATVGYPLMVLLVFTMLTGCTNCESLDGLALGTQIGVGAPPTSSFQPPTMDIGAHPFQWGTGTTTSSGYAKIEKGGLAGGSNNEMRVNNLVTSISVGGGHVLKAIRFSFGEYGGNLNVSVNNNFTNIRNFSDINGKTIGGVTVKVLSGGLGNDKGEIEFVGTMIDQTSGLGQFAVGGQELWIDNICFSE
jgi:hypothetical protein